MEQDYRNSQGDMYDDLTQDQVYVIRGDQMNAGAGVQPVREKRSIPIITIIIIIANVIAWIMCIGVDDFAHTGGLNYEYVKLNKEYGRFLSSMFLHLGIGHLFGNMFSLYLFGGSLERRLGSLRMTVIYFASGIAAGIVSIYAYHITDPGHMHFSVGASGAVFGIICAELFLTFIGTNKPNRKTLIITIVLVIIYAIYTNEENVNIYAHIGGAIAGGVFAFALNVKKWERFRENRFFKVFAIMLTVILSVFGIGDAKIGKKMADLNDERITYIKEQKIFDDHDITYGDGLDGYCTDEKWQVFTSSDGINVVEFDGNARYGGGEVSVLIQFVLSDSCSDYEVHYVGLDDKGQDSESATKFMMAVAGITE